MKKIYVHSVERKFLLVGDMTSSTYDVSIRHKSEILTENVSNYFKVFASLTQEVEATTRYNGENSPGEIKRPRENSSDGRVV